MLLNILAFLIGDLYLQTFTKLPTTGIIVLLLSISSVCFLFFRNKYIRFLSAFILGASWSAWYAHNMLSWTLPKELEDKPIIITGDIAALPKQETISTLFIFRLTTLDNMPIHKKVSIRLSWHHAPILKVGDQWQLMARLKRIHGIQSPGSFDFEAWSLTNGLRAFGSVMPSTKNIILAHRFYAYPVDSLRQYLQAKMTSCLPSTFTAHWLLTFMLGERHNVSQQEWQVLRSTGTNHLMAIGGLHIGIVAGFMYCLITWLWRRITYLMLLLPAQQAGYLAALGVAWIYSALAGFSLPTQRACLMLTFFILARLLRREINAWCSWSLALLCVLLLNPLSILTDSFWLSFGTIALIIYGCGGRIAPVGYWWHWGRTQWVIAIGLIPCSLIFFQQTSVIGFIANSIAIPWLTFLLLPFCFLSSLVIIVFPSLTGILLWLADKSLSGLWLVLSWLSSLPFAVWHQAIPNHTLLLLLILGVIILLQPIGLPGRWLGVIWCLPLFFYEPARPNTGHVWLTLLDVGQGLAIVVETKQHTLLYDTGVKFGNIDMGESVILPYMRSKGLAKLDTLIISHGDNDHIGGTKAILSALSIKSIFTSVPEKLPLPNTQYCLVGTHWQWDGVTFSFLHPDQGNLDLHNDSSCVLLIKADNQSILLPGDIEQYAENTLLKTQFNQLSATILVAPHHGSKTSGLREFIAAVNPQLVLYSTGYLNRYHLPNDAVIATYAEKGVRQLNTVNTGTIEIKKLNTINQYRVQQKRYWFDT